MPAPALRIPLALTHLPPLYPLKYQVELIHGSRGGTCVGRNWGADKLPDWLGQAPPRLPNPISSFIKDNWIRRVCSKCLLGLSWGVYSFFINVSAPHSIAGPWSAGLAEHTLAASLLSPHLTLAPTLLFTTLGQHLASLFP